MGLFDLIEQHHAVGAAAHLFGELAGLLVAHIARRRTDHAGHRILLHILAHVETDERVGAVEELVCQLLDQLRLADTSGADEDEACGAAAARQVGAAPLDGLCHQMDGLVLTDDLLFQLGFQPGQLDELRLLDLHRRDARPQLNDLCHIVHGHFYLTGSSLLCGQLCLELGDAGLPLGHLLIVDGLIDVGGLHVRLFLPEAVQLLLHLEILRDDRVGEIAAGAGFVQQVDGLIGQVAVRDIPLTEGDDGAQHIGIHLHMVVLLVILLDAVHDGQRIGHAGLFHADGLEAALKGLVLLDILAVLVEGGGADDLYLTAGEGRLEDVARVHGTLALTGGGDGVDLVNEQDDVAGGLDLAQQALDPLLELAAELGAGHEAGQIQQEDLLILQAHRDIALGDALRDALGDGRLADARLTDEAGVVLLAAAQNLDGAVDLAVAAHDVVELALPGFAGQVLAVGVEEFAAGRLFAVLLGLFAVSGIALRLDAQREGSAGAGDKVVVPFVLLAAHGLAHIHHEGEGVRVPHLIHHALHPVFHVIHVLVGHTELLHQVFHRLDVQLTRTVQAKALIFHLAVLHPLDEDDGRTFLTAIADHIGSS